MFYVVREYWDFILVALAMGVAIGWWSEGIPAKPPAVDPRPEATS